jgi:hypothetical protein
MGMLTRFQHRLATTTLRKMAAAYYFLTPTLAIIHNNGPRLRQTSSPLSISLLLRRGYIQEDSFSREGHTGGR